MFSSQHKRNILFQLAVRAGDPLDDYGGSFVFIIQSKKKSFTQNKIQPKKT